MARDTRPGALKDGEDRFAAVNALQLPYWVIWDLSGDRLTLRGGLVSSKWNAATVIFHDTAYMELPTYFHHAHFLVSPDFDRGRLKALESFDLDLTAYGLITDFGAPDGEEHRFFVLADRCETSVSAG